MTDKPITPWDELEREVLNCTRHMTPQDRGKLRRIENLKEGYHTAKEERYIMEPRELRELTSVKESMLSLVGMGVTVVSCDGDKLFIRLDKGPRMVHLKAKAVALDETDARLAISILDFATSPATLITL